MGELVVVICRGREGVPGVFVLDVLNGATPFDAADGETRRVAKAGHDARLPFQRAGDGLVDLGGVLQVDGVDVALGGRDDEELVLDVHAVDALLRIERAHGLGALQVPELDRLVP